MILKSMKKKERVEIANKQVSCTWKMMRMPDIVRGWEFTSTSVDSN